MKNKYIECGKIINTHGCHGGLKLESWCDSPEVLADFKRIFINKNGSYEELKIKKAAIFKQFVLFDVVGITDMDAALSLKGTVVYADRDDFELDEGEYFIADIIGSEVRDADSDALLGRLGEIINRGAQDIYVVKTDKGDVMIPVVDEFVIKVEVGKAIYVRPIPGMFDEA